jgi:hypothetical protein
LRREPLQDRGDGIDVDRVGIGISGVLGMRIGACERRLDGLGGKRGLSLFRQGNLRVFR